MRVIERAKAPGFIAGLSSGFAARTLDPQAIAPIADPEPEPEPERPGNRMNDAKADAAGRICAGTMPMADGVDEPAAGALFEVDPGVRGLAPHRFDG